MLQARIEALLKDRRACLWICQRYDLLPDEQPHSYDLPAIEAGLKYRLDENDVDTAIASLYWGAIWFEGANSPILRSLRRAQARGAHERSLVMLSSEADAKADLPYQDYLAAFVLPGIIDSSATNDTAYGSLSKRARESIAWDLAKRVGEFPGGLLVVIGAARPDDLGLLWDVLAHIQVRDLTILLAWEGKPESIIPPNNAAIELILFPGNASLLLNELKAAGVPEAGKHPGSIIRVGSKSVSLPSSATRYINKRFALLNESIFSPPSKLQSSDLESFFNGALDDWSCFSFGLLPVPRSYKTDLGISLEDDVLQGLHNLESGSYRSHTLIYQLPCSAASGATTLLRATAYNCARKGYPTLIAKHDQVEIDIEDLTSFVTSLSDSTLQDGIRSLPPLLVIIDVEHSRLNPAFARQIAQSLATQGRRALILQAIRLEDIKPFKLVRKDPWVVLPPLTSLATEHEVKACWERFSKLHSAWGLTAGPRSLEDWRRYSVASKIRGPYGELDSETLFWVAIRFFVCEGDTFLDQESLRDSLSSWITKRTIRLSSEDSRRLLQYIAVLSSFGLASPLMTVLRPITGKRISTSIVKILRELNDIVEWADLSEDIDDQLLAFRHSSIASEYLRSIGISTDDQKVEMLYPLFENLSPGSKSDLWLAEMLAATVLAPVDPHAVSDWDWRLSAFTKIPDAIAQRSKAILHHWARCLYGSSYDRSLTPENRRIKIELAIASLEKADALERKPKHDEHPGHIANTLGVAYSELAKFFQSEGNEALSIKYWNSACESFERSIALLPIDNVIAYLAFSRRLLWHAGIYDGPTIHTAQATQDVAKALALLDRADDTLSGISAPDPSWGTELALSKTKALNYLGNAKAKAYIDELRASASPGLALYCQARMLLGEHPEQVTISEAIELLHDAIDNGENIGTESARLFTLLLRTSASHQYDYPKQLDAFRVLEKEEGTHLSDIVDMFRLAVLCYQNDLFSEGKERFRLIREHVRQIQSFNAPPKLSDYWRDSSGSPKVAQVRVDKAFSDWRGEGYVEAIRQTVPLRPRHFTPIARQNDYRDCLIHFEVWGPWAIPIRLER